MARNRITNFLYIFSQLKFISAHGDKLGCMFQNLVVEKEVRWGLFSKYFLKCEICNEIFKIENVDNDSSNIPDINDAAVKGIMSIGRGLDDLEKFLDSLDIPYMLPKRCDIGQQQVSPKKAIETEEEKLYNGNNNSSRKEQKSEEDPNTNLRSESKTNNEVPVKNCNYEATLKQEDIYIKDEIIEDELQPSTSFSPENVTTTVKEEIPGFVLKTERDIDSENEISFISPDTRETTEVSSLDLLPEKTRKMYNATYKAFLNWKEEKNDTSFSESTLLSYFNELSGKYKPSTLWTHYSILRSMINVHQEINLEDYKKLRILLKRKSEGFQPKKAKTFSPKNISDFLNKACDEKYLATKVSLIMRVMGACKANEMHRMKTTDLQDLGSALLVYVPNSKGKVTRRFTITDKFYQICKKYINLRPSHVTTDVFFLNYQNGKCTSQRIGINKFPKMGREIATFLRLPNPEQYSGHSFRRSSAAILVT